MAELKTKKTESSVEDFLNSAPENRKEDGFTLLSIFKKITKEDPKMWGSSIVGFGSYHYKSERSSQEGDWLLTGFSPRKQNLSIYVLSDFEGQSELLSKLGKHKEGVGCLYVNKLADIDMNVLEEMIDRSFKHMKKIHSVE